jgi:hypothetical protein
MRAFLVVIAIVMLLVQPFPAAAKFDSTKYQKLGDNINQLFLEAIDPGQSADKRVKAVATRACNVLTFIAEDKDLAEVLTAAAKGIPDAMKELEGLRKSVVQMSRFLVFEKDALQRIGLNSQTTHLAIDNTTRVIRDGKALKLSPKETLDLLNELRKVVCTIKDAAVDKDKSEAMVLAIVLGGLGAAILIGDTLAIPTSSGLSVISVSASGILFTEALDALKEK